MSGRTNKTSLTPSRQEQIDIVKDTNEVSVYLYNYYVSIAKRPNMDLLDDSRIGQSIGWNSSKVKKNRLKLTNTGWIYFQACEVSDIGRRL